MLRIHMLQNMYDLSDVGDMTEVITPLWETDYLVVRASLAVTKNARWYPHPPHDCRNPLHKIPKMPDVSLLEGKWMVFKKGTMVDSTLIAAPSSTKNREKNWNPEIHQTPKGNAWYFVCKAHIGADKISGLLHHAETTVANVHDITLLPQLLCGEEQSVYVDSGYLGAEKREDALTNNNSSKKTQYKINHRHSQSKSNSTCSKEQIKRIELEKSSDRAKIEHVIGATKGLWGYCKTQYRGREKLDAQLHIIYTLANRYLADKYCLAA